MSLPRDFTSLAEPQYLRDDRVRAYAGVLMHSNYPPMPKEVRVAAAIRRAFEVGVMTGQRQIRKQLRRRTAVEERKDNG